MKLFIVFTVLAFESVCSSAQTTVDTTYRVEVTATACPMVNFFRLPRVPGTTSKTSAGYGMTGRILWHPGRLLSIGLLTGFLVIAEDKIPNRRDPTDEPFEARLTAVPLQIALTMRKHSLEIGIEIGPYLIMSTISGPHSAPVHSRRLELATTVFGSYLFTLNDSFQCGPELRVVDLRYRGIVCLLPSFSFRSILLRY